MRKYIVVTFIAILLSCSSGQQSLKDESLTNVDYKSNLAIIVNNLSQLVSKSKTKNKEIQKLVLNVVNRINRNDLKIEIDNSLPRNINDGARFGFINEGESPSIFISPYLIELYRKRPTIVYSIFIHEYQHAESFYSNKEHFVRVKDNLLEKYLYELDAYHIEALFIKDYLKPNSSFQLTKFELFLLDSHSNNNLTMFSYGFQSLDNRLVYHLNDLTHSKRSKEEKFKDFEKIIDSILNIDYDQYTEEGVRYNQIVPLNTLYSFFAQFVRDIETSSLSSTGDSQIIGFDLQKENPEFYRKFLKLGEKIKKYSKHLEYSETIRANFTISE